MKKQILRILVVTPGLIAGFLLVGTILAYTLSVVYSNFLIDVSYFPFLIGALFTLILIPTKIVGESFGEMLALNGNAFFVCWSTLLIAITVLSYFSFRKLHNN